MKRLQTKYSVAILILVVSIMVILAVITSYRFKSTISNISSSSASIMRTGEIKQLEKRAELLVNFLAEELVNPVYQYDMERIYYFAKSAKKQKDVVYVYVYEPGGRIIHDGTSELALLDKVLEDELSRKAVEAKKLIIQTTEDTMDAAAPIKIQNELLGGVRVGFSLKGIRKDIAGLKQKLDEISGQGVEQNFKSVVMLTVVLSVVSIFLAIFLARGLSRPIVMLSKLAARAGSGEYDVDIPIKRTDEIGVLAGSFKTMLEQIKERDAELEEYHQSLEKKVAERTAALERSETEHRSVLESSGDVIMRIDTEGTIHSVNKAVNKVFGYKEKELIGKNLSLIIPDELPRILLGGFTSSLDEWSGENFQQALEVEAVTEEGKDLPLELTISELILESKQFYVIIMRDISERKRAEEIIRHSEERFRKVFEYSNDAIFIVDVPGDRILEANSRTCEMLGYSYKELLSTPMSDIHPNEMQKLAEFAETVSEDGRGWTDELTCRTKSGEFIPAEISASLISMEGKTHMIAIVRDITERKRAEEDLRKARDKAEEATILKDKFVSLVSHDLKGPLGTMLGYLQLLGKEKAEPLNEGAKMILNSAVKSGENMVDLIEVLLNISRLQTGNIEPKFGFIDPYFIAVKAGVNLGLLARNKGIKLSNEVLQNSRIYADEDLFYEVIQNLVANAIKFCKEGDTIRIYIPEGRETTIAVADTGTGVKPEWLKALFDYEVKTSSRGTNGETGAGLGLPFCRDIMEAHGGTLTVESDVGRGSVFYASLPYVKPRVLLVGDEKSQRLLFKQYLKNLNVDILEAENGAHAIDILKEVLPHLIIADIRMPVMDGNKLLEELKNDPEKETIPVIVVTEDDEIEAREKALELGADDFLTKPLDINDFVPIVRRFVG